MQPMPASSEAMDKLTACLLAMDPSDRDGIDELRRGLDTVHEFYRVSAGSARLSLTGPIRVSGSEAAFPMLASLGPEDDPSYLDIIDVMTFDADARITSMRAFWSPDSIRR